MTIMTICLLGLGLAMDCFAVSIAEGAAYKQIKLKHTLRMAAFFGAFQALMPVIGWYAGLAVRKHIEQYDHWIAFALLLAIGAKMIYEGVKLEPEDKKPNAHSLTMVCTLAVATSIDALAVGVTLSLLHDPIKRAAIIIGVITFFVSIIGVQIGKKMGHFFEGKTEIAAGMVLIGLGVKILVQHLFA